MSEEGIKSSLFFPVPVLEMQENGAMLYFHIKNTTSLLKQF